ncbi:MAG: hypothetical protein AB8G11_22420 [Saprospiraceae bacterium]
MITLNDIVDKSLLLTFGRRLQRKNINVFPLYDSLGVDLNGVEECKKKETIGTLNNLNYIVLSAIDQTEQNDGNINTYSEDYVAVEKEGGTYEIIVNYASIEEWNHNVEITLTNSLGNVIESNNDSNWTYINEPTLQLLIITLLNFEQYDLTGTVSVTINGDG